MGTPSYFSSDDFGYLRRSSVYLRKTSGYFRKASGGVRYALTGLGLSFPLVC